MKNLLIALMLALSILTSAQAQTAPDEGEVARQTCVKAGFTPGTDLFGQCFFQVMKMEVEKKNKPTFLQQYLLNRASAPSTRTEVYCRPWMNGMICE